MRRVFLVVLFLLSLSLCHAAEWYPGIIHLHSSFSDGVFSLNDLAGKTRDHGASFIIVTDHYDLIPLEMKKKTTLSAALGGGWAAIVGPWGFDRYVAAVNALNRPGFVAIPGAEIGAKWYPEPGNEAASHTLALGPLQGGDDQLSAYCEQVGTQQSIIRRIVELGMLPVAAHPCFLKDGQPGDLSLLGRIDYRYDKRPADPTTGRQVQYQGLAGVEMWNVDKAERREDDIAFYLGLIRDGYRPFVTAGSDYHGYKPWEIATFERKTWVYADNLTTNGILQAIREGKTCAAQYGARLTQISPLPGKKSTMDRAVIKVRVEFPIPTTSQKEFVMYRDGNPVKSPPQNQPAGKTSYDYEWTDTDGSQGEHSYVLRVGEVLVTSPMWVGVTDEPLLSVEKAYVSKVSCSCMEAGLHGDIMIVLADGSQRKITANGLNSQPRISADGMTVGYLAGSHGKFWGDEHYIPDKICFFQSKGLPCLEAKYMIWDWQFRQDGKLVAIAVGAAKRGIQYYQLLDVQSGEVVDQCESDYFDAARGAKKPDWVTGLAKFE